MNGIGTMFNVTLDLWHGSVRKTLFDELELDTPIKEEGHGSHLSSKEGAAIDNICFS